jgi:hypothetical protein
LFVRSSSPPLNHCHHNRSDAKHHQRHDKRNQIDVLQNINGGRLDYFLHHSLECFQASATHREVATRLVDAIEARESMADQETNEAPHHSKSPVLNSLRSPLIS